MVTLWITALAILNTSITNDGVYVGDMDSYEEVYDVEGNVLEITDLGVSTAATFESQVHTINFNGGTISFDFRPNFGTSTAPGWYYYQFQFKAVEEPILSNVYLSNVKVHFPATGSYTAITLNLPNIYFRGTPFYSDSLDGDLFYYETQYTSANRKYYLTYDLEALPLNIANTDGTYQNGYNEGWNAGNDYGFEDGYDSGYQNGYNDAEFQLDAQGTTARVIFAGIIDVALLPINFFLACLNFEVFGINIGSFVTATMTVAIVIILFRTIFNGGNKND